MANETLKAEKIVEAAVLLLQREIVLPRLVWRQADDDFKGAKDDTITLRVPAVLEARSRVMRSNTALTFDEFAESAVPVKLDTHAYSGLKIRDEELTLDIKDFARQVVAPQMRAVAEKMENTIADALDDATSDYADVDFTEGTDDPYKVLVAARKVLNIANVPAADRIFVAGANVEAAILGDDKLVLAQNVGDSIAEGALREAYVGRVFGMNLITAQELPADKAYLIVPSAFVMATAAPAVPASVGFGATATAGANGVGGTAVRWVMDYDPTVLAERSVVNVYNGVRHVTDVFAGVDSNGDPAGAIVNGAGVVGEFFIRGLAFDVDATADVLPNAAANANASGVGGTAAANSLLDQFVKATGVGTVYS